MSDQALGGPAGADAAAAAPTPLIVIMVLLCLYTLHWAQAAFIPLLGSVLLSYALAPLVERLTRWHLPRALAAALVIGIAVGGIGGTAYLLRGQANELVEALPEAAQTLRERLRSAARGPESSVEKMQRAAAQLQRAAAEHAATGPGPVRGVTRVQIEQPAIDIQSYLLVGTMRLAELAAQLLVMCLLTFFLLAAGDVFRRKLVRIAGPTLSKRRITVQALDEIGEQMRRYVLTQLLSSAVVGLATGLAFFSLGLQNAAAWGVLAALLNLVPYIGAILLNGAAALVALLQFGTLEMAFAVGATGMGLRAAAGYLLLPWLTSRMSRLNTVAVFIGVLAWGWLWGVWGLLLGAPILMIIKAVCDRVDGLKAAGELLGSELPAAPR